MGEFYLIIHDVRSVHNVASMFRTADGAGVSKIFLTGYTPGPIDRFGRKILAFSKISLGAEEFVVWEKKQSIEILIQELQENGVQVVALEQDPRAVVYTKLSATKSVALLVGNEVEGISKEILKKVDTIIEIPMRGKKESLNVSVSAGIALYQLINNSPHQ